MRWLLYRSDHYASLHLAQYVATTSANKQSYQMAYIDKQYSLLHNQVYAVQKGLLQYRVLRVNVDQHLVLFIISCWNFTNIPWALPTECSRISFDLLGLGIL